MRGIKNISTYLKSLLATLAMMLICALQTKAQQDPIYTQYMNNLMSVNPAYIGQEGLGTASLISRKQWAGVNGSPFTTSLSLNMVSDSLKIGGGFDFVFDNYGGVNTTALFVDYSYRIKANQNSKLSFGLKGGFNYLQPNLNSLDRYHPDDYYILEYGDKPIFLPNVGVGLFYYGDNFYGGISVPRLLQNKYHKDAQSLNAASSEERHYFIHGAYEMELSPNVTFKPGITTIMVAGSPVTADFDFSFKLYETVWVGAMYRTSDALGGYAQMEVDNFKFGFSYDYSHTRLGRETYGTYEFMLKYTFRLGGKAAEVASEIPAEIPIDELVPAEP